MRIGVFRRKPEASRAFHCGNAGNHLRRSMTLMLKGGGERENKGSRSISAGRYETRAPADHRHKNISGRNVLQEEGLISNECTCGDISSHRDTVGEVIPQYAMPSIHELGEPSRRF
ncbi:uncharacterized protein LOC112589502 [Harpegnathos saltator]|uniref:uncharacterized protein LOC112589502 n=1 Tax=Harpegnathos saltator TaxID=610380 RepID=UPI000DBEDB6B|nr:uncharacterized protein LOC112589502 [Harpegnathos saltator]